MPSKNLFFKLAQYFDIGTALILLGLSYYLTSLQSLLLAGLSAVIITGRIVTTSVLDDRIKILDAKIIELEAAMQAAGLGLGNIRSVIDISRNVSDTELHSIVAQYVGINDPEFSAVKDVIISDATARLKRIATERRSEELGRGEYYQWLLPILEKVDRGQTVSAISIMSSAEWDESEEEEKFIKGNIEAAEKGATIERIFIVPKGQLEAFSKLAPVQKHLTGQGPASLVGYYIEREELERRDRNLLASLGEGFIDFNGKVAMIDNFGPEGEVRGHVTKSPIELRRIKENFGKLKIMAKLMNSENLAKSLPPPNAVKQLGSGKSE